MRARLPRAASSRYVAVDLDVGALSSLQACDSIVGYSSCYKRACRARLCEENVQDMHGGEQEMRERSLVQESGKRRRCPPLPLPPSPQDTHTHTHAAHAHASFKQHKADTGLAYHLDQHTLRKRLDQLIRSSRARGLLVGLPKLISALTAPRRVVAVQEH